MEFMKLSQHKLLEASTLNASKFYLKCFESSTYTTLAAMATNCQDSAVHSVHIKSVVRDKTAFVSISVAHYRELNGVEHCSIVCD